MDQETVVPSEQSRLAGARELTFRHALLRGAAYATLTEQDRALGHRLAAAWLESTDEDREVIAIHWLEGGDRARAASNFAQAAETRLGRAQTDAAARCAVRSLLVRGQGPGANAAVEPLLQGLRALAEGLETARAIDRREIMAGLELHVELPEDARGSNPRRSLVHVAIEWSLDALGSADGTTLATALARAAAALGAVSEFAAAKTLLARADALVAEHEASFRAIRYVAARVAFWEGQWFAVVENLSSTVLPADARERVAMLLLLAVAVVSKDGREALARGLDYATRAQALADALPDDPVLQVNCCKARIGCFYFAGEHQRACEASREAVALSRRAGLRYEEAMHLHNEGESWLLLGKPERGRATLLASNVIAEDLGTEPIRAHNDLLIAHIDGDVERLQGLADSAAARSNSWGEVHARYRLARLLASKGHPHARREFVRALALARALEVRILAAGCTLAMAALPPDRQSQMPSPVTTSDV